MVLRTSYYRRSDAFVSRSTTAIDKNLRPIDEVCIRFTIIRVSDSPPSKHKLKSPNEPTRYRWWCSPKQNAVKSPIAQVRPGAGMLHPPLAPSFSVEACPAFISKNPRKTILYLGHIQPRSAHATCSCGTKNGFLPLSWTCSTCSHTEQRFSNILHASPVQRQNVGISLRAPRPVVSSRATLSRPSQSVEGLDTFLPLLWTSLKIANLDEICLLSPLR